MSAGDHLGAGKGSEAPTPRRRQARREKNSKGRFDPVERQLSKLLDLLLETIDTYREQKKRRQ